MLIGPAEERWDLSFITQCPSVADFVAMIRDPVYREAVKHRQAVEDSRLIRLAPGRPASGSAEAPVPSIARRFCRQTVMMRLYCIVGDCRDVGWCAHGYEGHAS
jgi:hypothetical protein